MARRNAWALPVEVAAAVALIATLAFGYLTISRAGASGSLLTPLRVAILLLATLVPAMVLMTMAARRLAVRRSARQGAGLKGRLPARLVAIFSIIASVPTLLVVIFASMLFQLGVQFWFSDQARGMLENAASLARENYEREVERVNLETVTMSGDLASYLQQVPINSPDFAEGFARQVYERNLSEAIILTVARDGEIRSLALVNPYDRDLQQVVTPQMIAAVRDRRSSIAVPAPTGSRRSARCRKTGTPMFTPRASSSPNWRGSCSAARPCWRTIRP
jgi:two-component system, NtrC family, nitrogen regulation sensor histidine kinase NtrY